MPLSALQTVQSTPNIANQSDLIGKTVTGTVTTNGQASTVTGTVNDVTVANGIPTATIQVSKTQTTSLSLSNITSISD